MEHPRHGDHGERWQVASALLARPKTIDEIHDDFVAMGRRFGVFAETSGWPGGRGRERGGGELRSFLERTLTAMCDDGWARAGDSGRFELTDRGRAEAETMLADLRRSGTVLRRLAEPRVVSIVTLVVHFVLAAIKLPAALLSHSVGLLNDALDTLADGVSSLLVYAGIRTGRERLASIVLLVFMSATGVLTAIQAIARIVTGAVPAAEPLAFAAITASGVVCGGLFLYQRFAGVSHRSVPLIAQSIDSRNHVLVAGGVAVGLVAAVYELPYVDGIVGLIVSGLVLKGAVELFAEVARSREGEEPDLSAYGFARLERHRERSLVRWLLYQVDAGSIRTEEELEREAQRALDFAGHPSLAALGIADVPDAERVADSAVRAVRERHLVDGRPLALTEGGRDELGRALARRWASGGGPPVLAVARVLVVAGAAVVGFALLCALAMGLRWALGFLPAATVVAPGVALADPLGVAIGSADVWLAGFSLAIHLGSRFWSARRSRRRLGAETELGSITGRGHRGTAARLAAAVNLVLLTNSWWLVIAVAVQGAALVSLWIRARRRA